MMVNSFQAFLDDYEKFKNTVRDLDLRLSSIVLLAFDDCSSLEGMFKVGFFEAFSCTRTQKVD